MKRLFTSVTIFLLLAFCAYGQIATTTALVGTVTDASGKVANWNLELASPNMLTRNGWSRNSLKQGDKVSVTGLKAKDNSNAGYANSITFPDGRKLAPR